MDQAFYLLLCSHSDEIRKIVCNLSSISERYFAGKITQELAINQLRLLADQPLIQEYIQPYLSAKDQFFLSKSIYMEFRQLNNEDMHELLQTASLILIRLLDQYEEELAEPSAQLVGFEME